MTKQITLEELLELVTVKQSIDGKWHILDVKGHVYGYVDGDVKCDVYGSINGREWQFVETPKEKLKRLIEETGNEELIEAFYQLEDN